MTLPSGETVHNPTRVVPHGKGSEFVFTLIRRPGMSDAQFLRRPGGCRAGSADAEGIAGGITIMKTFSLHWGSGVIEEEAQLMSRCVSSHRQDSLVAFSGDSFGQRQEIPSLALRERRSSVFDSTSKRLRRAFGYDWP